MSQAYTDKHSDQATEWLVRLRSPAANASTRVAFSRWLNQAAAHEAAFDAALNDWQTTRALAYSEEAQACLRLFEQTQTSPQRFRKRLTWLASATAALLVAALVFGLQPWQQTPEAVPSQLYTTQIGEIRSINLADGSKVKLNTHSSLRVQYLPDSRRLMLDQGEAFFEVAPNKQRPFVVETPKGSVTAVGTAFAVDSQADAMKVTVIEGIVSVEEHQTQPEIQPERRLVKADQQLQIDTRGLSEVIATHAAIRLAWRDGLLVLENRPLTEVIAELNRYLDTPVDASDPSLAGLKVSGTFSLQTPKSTLEGLLTSFNLAVDTHAGSPRLYRPTE